MSDCDEPCDGCPKRAEHHLCDECCHAEPDAIAKENATLRADAARQRAEIRRLRAELREVARCTECVQCHVRAERVLAPKRRARK